MIVRDAVESNPFSLEFEERKNYLYIYIRGDHDSLEIKRQIWKAIELETQKLNPAKMLVVEDIKETGTMLETYQLAVEIAEMKFNNILIAFVDRFHDEQHQVNKFGEDVATNRGVRGKLFKTVEEAEKWLAEN